MNEMSTICLDPGHGGADPGAVGNGLHESDVVLDIALKARAYLEAVGHSVVMTRETDTFDMDELQLRCDVSDNSGADVFISIHCNSANSASATGTETFYQAGSEKGHRLAAYVQQQLLSLGLDDRGLKTNPLYVVRCTEAPAILVELGFLSNPYDADIINNNRDEFAAAIARGITDYLYGE